MRNGLSSLVILALLALLQPLASLSSAQEATGGGPNILAPCGEHGSLQLDDCNSYSTQFHEALVKSYHERWETLRQGRDPDQPGVSLQACNPFGETLRLTAGGGNLAFNGLPQTQCGSWGQITSKEKPSESPNPDPSSTPSPSPSSTPSPSPSPSPSPPTLEWSIEMSNSSAEGALWNGITHVHFVAVALKTVLDEVRTRNGFSFQYTMRDGPAAAPAREYNALFSRARALSPNTSGYTCTPAEGVQPAQKECYRVAVKETLKLYFLRLAQARVAEIVFELSRRLEQRFPTLSSSCNENGNNLRYPCNSTSDGVDPKDQISGQQVGAFLIRDIIRSQSYGCATGVSGQSCRQSRYESAFTDWIKQTASSITQETSRGDAR